MHHFISLAKNKAKTKITTKTTCVYLLDILYSLYIMNVNATLLQSVWIKGERWKKKMINYEGNECNGNEEWV